MAALLRLREELITHSAGPSSSLSPEASVALHRALDQLLMREASRARSPAGAENAESSFHDRFMALLGHDLRNPISAVKLATSILARDTQNPEARRRTLQRITSNTDRLLRTLEDSLDYSRLFRGKELSLDPTRLDLDAASRSVLSVIEAAYPTRSFAYESPGPREAIVDKDRFNRLLSNLLIATVEHAPADSETHLRLSGDSELCVSVENSALILSEAELDHVFDSPLADPQGTTRRPRGFGVGLFVGERVMKSQGGSLQAKVLTPAGTAFEITLPRAP